MKMNLDNAIHLLRERIKLDRESRNFKADSDYEKFCEEQCIATEVVLDWVLAERSKLTKR